MNITVKKYLTVNWQTGLVLFTTGIVTIVAAYLYFEMRLAIVDYLKSMIFYGAVICTFTGLSFIILHIYNATEATSNNVLLTLFTLSLTLLFAENALRCFKVNRAYIENRDSGYMSPYVRYSKNYYHKYEPSTKNRLVSPEFNYPRSHNNYGFSDTDFFAKKDSQILIQTYGDSFTEGDGTSYDSSYPYLLNGIFKKNYSKNILVQNFGICGSDPGFYYQDFKDIGITLHPDIIIMTYGSFDMATDFLTKGGLERFKNGSYTGSRGPGWEWLYAYSYIFRLVMHSVFNTSYDNFFITDAEKQKRIKALEPKWIETFLAIDSIACIHNTKILLIKKPERLEVDFNKYMYDFTFFENAIDTLKEFKRYDLLTYYRNTEGIKQGTSAGYYWANDGHHNATGYALMARGVHAALIQSYPEIFSNLDLVKVK